MSRTTPKMRSLAKRLIACEAQVNLSAAKTSPTAFRVPDKLRPHLVALMGTGGFRALLSRALALANQNVPWLRAVQVKADGTLEGVEDLPAPLTPDEFIEGRVALLAQLLELLVAFIGEALTLRLVQEVWPQVSLNDLEFGHGDKNEKTK